MINKLYKKHEKLVKQRAWAYAKKYNLDFDEVFSEANSLFFEAYEKYDQSKAQFTTFLFHHLKNGLSAFCSKEWKKRAEIREIEDTHASNSQINTRELLDFAKAKWNQTPRIWYSTFWGERGLLQIRSGKVASRS